MAGSLPAIRTDLGVSGPSQIGRRLHLFRPHFLSRAGVAHNLYRRLLSLRAMAINYNIALSTPCPSGRVSVWSQYDTMILNES